MEDIPQPAPEPYDVGDTVQIHLAPDDTDSHLHGLVCTVKTVHQDDLDEETGRQLDAYSYQVQAKDNEEISVWFRHSDLIPLNNTDME